MLMRGEKQFVWDGCSTLEAEIFGKVQLEGARIITSPSLFHSRNALYLETGLATLSVQ